MILSFQVVWDEPDLLQNVKCVNPWLVELVTNIPSFHLSPFSTPRKKPRFLNQPDFPLMNQLPMPSFSSNLVNHTNSLCNVQDYSNSAGIQGARQAQFGLSSSEFPFSKLQSDLLLGGITRLDNAVQPVIPHYMSSTKKNVDRSCLLSVGNSGQSLKEPNKAKSPHILLFGQIIHTEQQASSSFSLDNSLSEGKSQSQKTSNDSDSALLLNSPVENSSDGGSPWYKDQHNSDIRTKNVNLLCLAL